MTRPSFIHFRTALIAPLIGLVAGCAAFDAGPQSEAARAANAANPGYPRLADVPPAVTDPPSRAAHEAQAAELIAAREELSAAAEQMRAARPADPSSAERIDLPEDMPRPVRRGEGAQ